MAPDTGCGFAAVLVNCFYSESYTAEALGSFLFLAVASTPAASIMLQHPLYCGRLALVHLTVLDNLAGVTFPKGSLLNWQMAVISDCYGAGPLSTSANAIHGGVLLPC